MKNMKTKGGDKPKIVGLSGGIAAGKSAARRAFESYGVPCLDLDVVARNIHQDPDHPATHEIAKTFAGWMTADGALQRGSLHKLFARDAEANGALIGILKPHVLEAVKQWTQMQHTPYVVWESALLVREAIAVDRLLIVEAPVALRLARMHSRNPDWSEEQVAQILAMQVPLLATSGSPDSPPSLVPCSGPGAPPADAICNDGSAAYLHEQVQTAHRRYTALWS